MPIQRDRDRIEAQRERERSEGAHPEDMTRSRQYRGVDPSGYRVAPRWQGHPERGAAWQESAPGNYGEAGGRWHDHELPFHPQAASTVGLGEAMHRAERRPDLGTPERGGFEGHAHDLWPGGPGGTYGYGWGGGREGVAPRADERRSTGALGAQPGGAADDAARTPRGGRQEGKGPRGYVRGDARIHEDVCDALQAHGEIDATSIEVLVENGEVTLTGEVDDRRTKRLADAVAGDVRGVNDVHNRLTIRRTSPRTDA